MQTQTTMTDIYDIAVAFITDRDTKISVHNNDGSVSYTFTKYGLADYPYRMEIYIPCGAPEKLKLKGSYTFHTSRLDNNLHMKWHQQYKTDKKQGKIYLQQGTSTNLFHTHTLLSATTKHNVGRANDKTQTDLTRFITRKMSPRFFKLATMAQKRTRGEIQTSDNSAMLFNMIYRIKKSK